MRYQCSNALHEKRNCEVTELWILFYSLQVTSVLHEFQKIFQFHLLVIWNESQYFYSIQHDISIKIPYRYFQQSRRWLLKPHLLLWLQAWFLDSKTCHLYFFCLSCLVRSWFPFKIKFVWKKTNKLTRLPLRFV